MPRPWTLLILGLAFATVPAQEAASAPWNQLVQEFARPFESYGGVVVGMLDGNRREFLSLGVEDAGRGALGPRTTFEIGSISKVFTALLLADAVVRQECTLETRLDEILPEGVTTPKRGEFVVTLRQLARHTSGFPRLPTNLKPQSPADPYREYGEQALLEWFETGKLYSDPGKRYVYSNLGAGALGHFLARRGGKSYPELLRERVLTPLGLTRTQVGMVGAGPSQAIGHRGGRAVSHWEFGALAGAGGICSDAEEMLEFAAVCLRIRSTPVTPAIELSLQPFDGDQVPVTLGWHVEVQGADRFPWHNGGTGGFSSFLGLDPQRNRAVVVLCNAADYEVTKLGMHLLDRRFPAP